jgi:epidermal growth factor receptor substrate 15
MLKSQADEQERTLKDQEDELNQRKHELDELKAEELRLETTLKNSKGNYEGLNSNLQETHLLISQVCDQSTNHVFFSLVTLHTTCASNLAWCDRVAFLQAKAKITQLEEQKRQMDDAIVLYEKALTTNDAYAVPDTSLEPISTEFREPEFVQFAMVNGTNSPSEVKVQNTSIKNWNVSVH